MTQRFSFTFLFILLGGLPLMGFPRLMIVKPQTEGYSSDLAFNEVLSGLLSVIGDEFSVHTHLVAEAQEVAAFMSDFYQIQPNYLVLMDTKAVNLYMRVQKKHADQTFPPAVMVMTVFIEQKIPKLKNTVGIEYQVQAVTSLVALRSLFKKPLTRVGVLYREEISSFIKEQQELCNLEKIELVAKLIKPKHGAVRANDINKGLKQLIKTEKVDAIWILNDSILLKQELLIGGWIPRLRKSKVTTVVNLRKFAEQRSFMGQFAVVPDHFGLGHQTAELLFSIQSGGLPEKQVFAPISIIKLLNKGKLTGQQRGGLLPEALLELDEVMAP